MSTITLTINDRNRLELSTTIERLLNMLDDLEPDADLEPDCDGEPTLGFPDQHVGRGAVWLDPREACADGENEPEETDKNGDEGDYDYNSEDEAQSHQWHVDPSMRFMGGQGL
jgi:hypothetical protein